MAEGEHRPNVIHGDATTSWPIRGIGASPLELHCSPELSLRRRDLLLLLLPLWRSRRRANKREELTIPPPPANQPSDKATAIGPRPASKLPAAALIARRLIWNATTGDRIMRASGTQRGIKERAAGRPQRRERRMPHGPGPEQNERKGEGRARAEPGAAEPESGRGNATRRTGARSLPLPLWAPRRESENRRGRYSSQAQRAGRHCCCNSSASSEMSFGYQVDASQSTSPLRSRKSLRRAPWMWFTTKCIHNYNTYSYDLIYGVHKVCCTSSPLTPTASIVAF